MNKILFLFQDVLRLETPGGGGYGVEDTEKTSVIKNGSKLKHISRGSVYNYKCAQESG